MAYLRIALIVLSCVYAPAATGNMTDCVKRAEDALAAVPAPTPRNLKPGVSPQQYDDAMARVFSSLLAECARQECRRDVRECIKVREYEEAEKRLRQAN